MAEKRWHPEPRRRLRDVAMAAVGILAAFGLAIAVFAVGFLAMLEVMLKASGP